MMLSNATGVHGSPCFHVVAVALSVIVLLQSYYFRLECTTSRKNMFTTSHYQSRSDNKLIKLKAREIYSDILSKVDVFCKNRLFM